MKKNAAITRTILKGEQGTGRNIVLPNSEAVLVAAEMADTIQNGIDLTENSIDSGCAFEKLNHLITYTRENG